MQGTYLTHKKSKKMVDLGAGLCYIIGRRHIMEEQTVKEELSGIIAKIIVGVIVGSIALFMLMLMLGESIVAAWVFVLSVAIVFVLCIVIAALTDTKKIRAMEIQIEAEKEAKEEAIRRCPLLQKIQEEKEEEERRDHFVRYACLNIGS